MRSKNKYDVLIIGAGPIGTYVSLKLAEAGLSVLVLEEDAEIGKPRFCTGIISREAFDQFCLPREAIEKEFSSAVIFSPLGSIVKLESKTIQVYATDRAIFDSSLWRLAKMKGVEFSLNCRCTGLKIYDDCAQADIVLDGIPATVRSKMVILTTGIKYNLHHCVGLKSPTNFLDCAQVQATGEGNGTIEVFLGNGIAPHSFAWVVPLKQNSMRIGLSTYRNSPHFLKYFLKGLELKGRIKKDDFKITRRPIPLGTIDRTYSNRCLAVGDAAGQVKPTTGGGIYFGLLCAELAAQTIVSAFEKRDFSERFLKNYETKWKKKIEFDLTMGLYLRKLVANIGDEQIEKLVNFCAQEPIQELMEKYADFNHHGRIIKELIKMPSFWKSFYQILAAK
jgi:digeranylgeranylglycerophospholipid reductase